MTASLPRAETKPILHWQPATWADYERYRDDSQTGDRWRLWFNDGRLMVQDMGWEGIAAIEHYSQSSNLSTANWFMQMITS
jgi:hypothetical protein